MERSKFNTLMHGGLQEVSSIIDGPCDESEVRAALQNVIGVILSSQREISDLKRTIEGQGCAIERLQNRLDALLSREGE